MQIAEKLKLGRKQQHDTQSDVANELHLSRKTISGWETGHSYPDVNSLVQLSDLYKISLDDLLRDDHILAHYEDESKTSRQFAQIHNVSEYLNILLLLLGYIDLFRPKGFHTGIIPVLILANLIVLITHYPRKRKMSRGSEKTKVGIGLFMIFIFNSVLSVTVPQLDNLLSNRSVPFIGGFFMGRFLLIVMISISLLMVIWFLRNLIRKGENGETKDKK